MVMTFLMTADLKPTEIHHQQLCVFGGRLYVDLCLNSVNTFMKVVSLYRLTVVKVGRKVFGENLKEFFSA